MSDEIRAEIKAAAKALCHYPSGPSAVNSCCPGIGRCEMDAAIAEIARLRAALATARREGMKEAADLCDDLPDHQGGICAIAIRMMIDEEDKKAAIRAAAKEVKL